MCLLTSGNHRLESAGLDAVKRRYWEGSVSDSVDKSLDKRKLFRVRSSNASHLSHECFLSFPIAANKSELFF